MNAMLVCASHSPLMLVDMPPSGPDSQAFLKREAEVRARVARFDPQLVVVFGPDHFNGFFFDLMPPFCIGAAAETTQDWSLPRLSLNVPAETALACVHALRSEDIDVALSWKMRADHGISIALRQFTAAPERYRVLPIFINCAAPPRPSFRRARQLGAAVGRFLRTLGERVLIVGSGGLSHDPPTPRFDAASPEVRKRLVERHVATAEELAKREARVVQAAHALVRGEGPCLPPDEAWDRAFLDRLLKGRPQDCDSLTDDELDRKAGFGSHELRTWVAAFAAMRELGDFVPRVEYYRVVPEWITGMGIVTAKSGSEPE
jgi:2,3-dihydroxyphenylpropionate 1,2-dioxygenase